MLSVFLFLFYRRVTGKKGTLVGPQSRGDDAKFERQFQLAWKSIHFSWWHTVSNLWVPNIQQHAFGIVLIHWELVNN